MGRVQTYLTAEEQERLEGLCARNGTNPYQEMRLAVLERLDKATEEKNKNVGRSDVGTSKVDRREDSAGDRQGSKAGKERDGTADYGRRFAELREKLASGGETQ